MVKDSVIFGSPPSWQGTRCRPTVAEVTRVTGAWNGGKMDPEARTGKPPVAEVPRHRSPAGRNRRALARTRAARRTPGSGRVATVPGAVRRGHARRHGANALACTHLPAVKSRR